MLMGEFGMAYEQDGGSQYLEDLSDIAVGYGWHFAYWSWRGAREFNYEKMPDAYMETIRQSFSKTAAPLTKQAVAHVGTLTRSGVSLITVTVPPGTAQNVRLVLTDLHGRTIFAAEAADGSAVPVPAGAVAPGTYVSSVLIGGRRAVQAKISLVR
jgi:hypothetical protein